MAAPLVVLVGDESGGVEVDGVALVLLPVVELFVCVEFDRSVLVCGVVWGELLGVDADGALMFVLLPVPLASVVD